MSPFQHRTKIKHERKRSNPLKKFLKPEILNGVILAMIVVVGVSYLVEVNRATTKGYKIRDLERQIQGLEESAQKVEMEIAELQSLDSIEERVEKLGMVPVDRIEYVKVPGATVAVR